MPIPIGSGTEVLKNASVEQTSSASAFKPIDGVANHIYTLLSVTIMNTSATTADIDMWLAPSGSGQIWILKDQPVANDETFVFSDRIVLSGTDELLLTTSQNNAYIVCSYLDQDWS